jgi:hypothetical protein
LADARVFKNIPEALGEAHGLMVVLDGKVSLKLIFLLLY